MWNPGKSACIYTFYPFNTVNDATKANWSIKILLQIVFSPKNRNSFKNAVKRRIADPCPLCLGWKTHFEIFYDKVLRLV